MVRRACLAALLVLLLCVVGYVSFSQEAADWWATQPSPMASHGVLESVRAPSYDVLGRGSLRDGWAVHVVMWSVTSFVTFRLFAGMAKPPRRVMLGGFLIGAGILVEVMQEMFTLRNAEVSDVIGNIIGVSLALLAAEALGQPRATRRISRTSKR